MLNIIFKTFSEIKQNTQEEQNGFPIAEFEVAIDKLLLGHKLGTYEIEDSDRQLAYNFYDGIADYIELDEYDIESRRKFLIELYKFKRMKLNINTFDIAENSNSEYKQDEDNDIDGFKSHQNDLLESNLANYQNCNSTINELKARLGTVLIIV